MGRFPSHFYWILLFLRFLRRLGNLLRSGCTTQASRSPSSLRLQNWRHCGVSRLRKQTKQTSPVAADKCSKKNIYRSVQYCFLCLLRFCCLWLREKIGHPKKNTVGTYQLQWYGNSICSSNWLAPRGWGIWRPKSLSSLALSIHHLVIPSTGLTLDGLWIWLQSFCARGSFLWQYHSYQSWCGSNAYNAIN